MMMCGNIIEQKGLWVLLGLGLIVNGCSSNTGLEDGQQNAAIETCVDGSDCAEERVCEVGDCDAARTDGITDAVERTATDAAELLVTDTPEVVLGSDISERPERRPDTALATDMASPAVDTTDTVGRMNDGKADTEPNEPDSYCTISGETDDQIHCQFALAAADSETAKATGLQFTLNFDAAKLQFDGWSCAVPGAPYDLCQGNPTFNVPPALTSGHGISNEEKAPGEVLVVFFSAAGAVITDAYYDAGTVVGDANFAKALFTVLESGSHPADIDEMIVSLGGVAATYEINSEKVIVTQVVQ